MRAVVLALTLIFTGLPPTTYEARTITHVNVRRANHDLPALRHGQCLERVANQWARHLAVEPRLSHRAMSDVFDTCGGTAVGEVIVRGTFTPRRAVRAWMLSPLHRDVILGDYDRIGVGAVRHDGRWVVVANVKRGRR